LSDIFLNGGAVMTPPTTGAIFQLVDPTGTIIHEYAAMPVGIAISGVAVGAAIVLFASDPLVATHQAYAQWWGGWGGGCFPGWGWGMGGIGGGYHVHHVGGYGGGGGGGSNNQISIVQPPLYFFIFRQQKVNLRSLF
jgi:hypothetical protein